MLLKGHSNDFKIHICVCMYMCMCVHLCVYVFSCKCVHACICVCACVCVCLRRPVIHWCIMTLWPHCGGHRYGGRSRERAFVGNGWMGGNKSMFEGKWGCKWRLIEVLDLASPCGAAPFRISIWLWKGRTPLRHVASAQQLPLTLKKAGISQILTF